MIKPSLLFALLILVLHLEVNGVTPVHVGKISVDTSIYDFSIMWHYSVVPGPYITNGRPIDPEFGQMVVYAFFHKKSNQADLYSFNGKIGTSVIPILREPADYLEVIFSCYMIDNDDGWESIVNYYYSSGKRTYYFKVFDDNGTELLADSGFAYYGFDGNSTYVLRTKEEYHFLLDSWRFRTNISSSSPSLSKSKAVSSGLMNIYGQDNGNYRVTLSPSSGNQVNFQMFDLLGKCVFSKKINNLTTPQSFIIPESKVPGSPFIAKVTDENGSYCKKQIPVK